MSLRKNFGRRVRYLRKANDMTQELLGTKANLDYKHLGAIERGEKNLTIENIAVGLKVCPYQLFLFSQEDIKPGKDETLEKIIDLLHTTPEETRPYLLKIVQLVAQIIHPS